jgi:sporulation protein YlmC with PRC-barrel domain
MRKNFLRLLIFASAGAIFQLAVADNISSPGQSMSLRRATELIGMDVRNQQDEKLGAVKDVMVDLQSGQAPFAVISSGGFFGVGDRMLAVPTTRFAQNTGADQFVLNMDRERLKSAPGFDKNNWPNMDDAAWRSQVYSYYGAQPARSSSVASGLTSQTEIDEAAGARSPSIAERSDSISQEFGETTTGLSRDRTPRKGLGAADLTKNEEKINNPGGYAESDAFIHESSGAEKPHHAETFSENPQPAVSGKIKRATDLIGMEVKDARNERIGEIKDVVIDMPSGRVAYAVLDASGLLANEDKLYAVPPATFTQSGTEQWLVLNTDKETLSTAPGFSKEHWPQGSDSQFTSQVYRFYHQQPYWQNSRQIQESSGTSSRDWQKGAQNRNEQKQIQEPSGAAPVTPVPGGEINQGSPKQTEPERNPNGPLDSAQNKINGSAAKETSELQSTPQYQQQQSAQEPAGAATESTALATSEDQAASDLDRRMSQQVRMALKNDASLSAVAPNVQVSTAKGRITLRGTVSSEQEKQSIVSKAQEIAGSADKIDNQLKVNDGSNNP